MQTIKIKVAHYIVFRYCFQPPIIEPAENTWNFPKKNPSAHGRSDDSAANEFDVESIAHMGLNLLTILRIQIRRRLGFR